MAAVHFREVVKEFGKTRVLHGISLDIADGEFVVLVGPSGCGKSTLLRMLAGLEDITGGTIAIDGRVVNEVDSKDRDIAMVFQSYALYPHMTVRENMAFALKLAKTPQATIDQKVEEAARVLDLTQHLDRKPANLSGGQRQRVAMGRAIVRDPAAFLMDEPLSNLDAKLRVQMRSEVARIQHELQATTVYVTHDQIEAMTMGDRVALLRRGVLQQVDTPLRLYNAPANLFVASFIGSPAMNLFEAQLERRNGHMVAQIGDQFLRLAPDALAEPQELERYAGRKLALGIRPEHLEDAAVQTGAPSERRLRGTVRTIEALGSELIAHLEISGRPVLSDEVKEIAADLDDSMLAELEAEAHDAKLPLVGRFDVASRAKADQSIEVVVDTSRIHYFDVDTGAAIGGHPVAAV